MKEWLLLDIGWMRSFVFDAESNLSSGVSGSEDDNVLCHSQNVMICFIKAACQIDAVGHIERIGYQPAFYSRILGQDEIRSSLSCY